MRKPASASSDKMMMPELPRSVAAVAAKHLEREIVEGHLSPGSRLIEEEWAEKFGISRGSFREVLRILEAAKLVEIIPRRGAHVARVNRRDVEEIYILRKHIFKLAYVYAAAKISAEDIESFRSIVSEMARVAERGDVIGFSSLSQQFDDQVLDVADIIRLRMVVEFLGKQTVRYRYIGFKIPGRMERSLAAHKVILEAFAARNGELAGETVFEMIEWAGKSILSSIFADGMDSEEVARDGRSKRGARSTASSRGE